MTETVRFTLLQNATVPGAIGTGLLVPGAGDGPIFNMDWPYIAAAWQIEFPGGAPAALSGSILGLIDGNTWGSLATFTQATASGLITAFTYPLVVRAIKANIASITVGAGGGVNLFFAGRR